jgi:hypothetical protein
MRTQPIRSDKPLTDDQIIASAPSVFAVKPWDKMSSKYSFIPTIKMVNRMRGEGFFPVYATQSRTRIEGKEGFTKHMIKFRDMRRGSDPAIRVLGTLYPEIALTNSHDGASSYKLNASLFRLICLNGMMASEGSFKRISFRHSGNTDGIIDATYEIVAEFPKMVNMAGRFSEIKLTERDMIQYGEQALALRYEEGKAPITPVRLMSPRREEDFGSTLWVAFNVAQENLMSGGIKGITVTGRKTKTRAITGIEQDIRLNQRLWELTETVAAAYPTPKLVAV